MVFTCNILGVSSWWNDSHRSRKTQSKGLKLEAFERVKTPWGQHQWKKSVQQNCNSFFFFEMLGNHGLKHDQRKPVSVVQQLFWKPFLLQQLSWVLRTLFVIFLCAAPPCKMKTAGCKLELPTKTPFHLPGSVNPSLLIHAVISSFSKEWMDVANRNLCWWIPLHDDMIGFKSFCIVLHDNSTICIFLDKLPKTRSKQTEHQNINIIKQYLAWATGHGVLLPLALESLKSIKLHGNMCCLESENCPKSAVLFGRDLHSFEGVFFNSG